MVWVITVRPFSVITKKKEKEKKIKKEMLEDGKLHCVVAFRK